MTEAQAAKQVISYRKAADDYDSRGDRLVANALRDLANRTESVMIAESYKSA